MGGKNTTEYIPECRSMNFSVYSGMLDRYKDSEDIMKSCQDGGLNGLEVILAGESDQGKIKPEMVNGVHLYFHIFWMDFWKGDYDRLDREFDSRQQWIDYYGGTDRECYLNCLRRDLDYAEKIGAKYVVFHVSEVTLRESYTYQYKYTNEEVIDASLEVINTLLDEREYPFDFLVENLWWSGLTMKEPALTKKLVEGIHSSHKGIMLDTGHFMNTNSDLKTPEDAVAYINQMLDAHEEAGFPITDWIKGLHLQMSLSGDYVKKQKADWKEQPIDFDNVPFYDLFQLAYQHACDIDLHQPFCGQGVKELINRIKPDYVTFEYQQNSREEYEGFVKKQSALLGYI
ncbi:MAG: TIM barrel protein [Eubacterium sp.]|nr:TIM barrel protein [Eubacterium sp.]MDD7209469.1 TIM barrel protein [Lachnospiraceae bacterium]MDY5497517.1 TIM barrel protein [Anaerobutyricum sp.]